MRNALSAERSSSPPPRLLGVPDASVDIATTRSVLICVADKSKAFSALHRVLRPGGRISLFEPINRLTFPEPTGRFWGYDLSAVPDLVTKVSTALTKVDDPAFLDAIMGFDDRDLVRLAEHAGFERIHVECHHDVEPGPLGTVVSLQALLDSAPNPNAPTIREAIETALTSSERMRFLRELDQALTEGRAIRRMAVAYVIATRASSSH
jgi:arsenite methyltransferase